jgi:hypothetical protein
MDYCEKTEDSRKNEIVVIKKFIGERIMKDIQKEYYGIVYNNFIYVLLK